MSLDWGPCLGVSPKKFDLVKKTVVTFRFVSYLLHRSQLLSDQNKWGMVGKPFARRSALFLWNILLPCLVAELWPPKDPAILYRVRTRKFCSEIRSLAWLPCTKTNLSSPGEKWTVPAAAGDKIFPLVYRTSSPYYTELKRQLLWLHRIDFDAVFFIRFLGLTIGKPKDFV